MKPLRDSHYANVWLSAEVAAFLDGLYPDDELPVQVARCLKDTMRAEQCSRDKATSRVQVLRFPDLEPVAVTPVADTPVPPPQVAKPLIEPDRKRSRKAGHSPETLRQLAAAADSDTSSESTLKHKPKKLLSVPAQLIREISPLDPISRLMQLGQRVKLASPVFDFEQSTREGIPWFACRCRWEHFESTESAGSKKAVKHAAASTVWNLIIGEA